jgi:hypothetical protein
LESKQYVLKQDGSLEEHYNRLGNAVSTLPKHDAEKYILEQVLKFIEELKGK